MVLIKRGKYTVKALRCALVPAVATVGRCAALNRMGLRVEGSALRHFAVLHLSTLGCYPSPISAFRCSYGDRCGSFTN